MEFWATERISTSGQIKNFKEGIIMRYTIFRLAVPIMIAIVAVLGCSKRGEPPIAGAPGDAWMAEEEVAQPTKASGGRVMVDEYILVILVDQPGERFHTAREKFLGDYLAAAADEIRIGAGLMKLETNRATEEGKEALMNSVQELATLADDVELNTIADVVILDGAFARANHALAKHHHLKAQEYLASGEDQKAATELEAAAGNIERGFGWAGQKMEEGAVATIRGARLLTGKAIQAPGWVISKSGRALAAMGRGVGRGIGAVGRGTGEAVGAVGDVATGVGRGTGEVVKGVGTGAGKVVEGVTGGAGEAVEVVGEETRTGVVVGEAGKAVKAVGKGTGDVVEGVGAGAGTVAEAAGTGAGTVVKGIGAGTGEAVEAVGKGVAWVPEQVGNSIDSIGKLIQRLGKAVEPERK